MGLNRIGTNIQNSSKLQKNMAEHPQFSSQIKVPPVSITIALIVIEIIFHMPDNERLGGAINPRMGFQEVVVTQPDVPLRPGVARSVAGFHAKLALVAYHGRFYLRGGTPPAPCSRWDVCDDLAVQLSQNAGKAEPTGARTCQRRKSSTSTFPAC